MSPKLPGHMLIDPSRREDVGRCQSWRRLVARKPLYWVAEKVCYMSGGVDAMSTSHHHHPTAPPSVIATASSSSSAGDGKVASIPATAAASSPAPPVGGGGGSGVVSSLLRAVFEGEVLNSLTNSEVASAKYWENASDGVQAQYIGTFFTIGSSLGGDGKKSALSHGGSGAISANGVAPGMIERPELFMCLLFRALMLSDQIPSSIIMNMITQEVSKYLRVFGLFLGRFLFADRNQPELLRRAWEVCESDSRSIRVLRTKGGKSVVGIETVDGVAFELMTSKQWEGNLTFPWCKPLE